MRMQIMVIILIVLIISYTSDYFPTYYIYIWSLYVLLSQALVGQSTVINEVNVSSS